MINGTVKIKDKDYRFSLEGFELTIYDYRSGFYDEKTGVRYHTNEPEFKYMNKIKGFTIEQRYQYVSFVVQYVIFDNTFMIK
jgi:hypothetical protein